MKRIFAFISVILLLAGCTQTFEAAPPGEAFDSGEAALSGVESTTTTSQIALPRLTQLRLAQAREAAVKPLALDVSALQPVAISESGKTMAALVMDVPPFPAERYNELRIELKTTAGGQCRFLWQSDLKNSWLNGGEYATPVVSDGETRAYVIGLEALDRFTWAGNVNKLGFAIPGHAQPEIVSAAFGFSRPEAARRVALQTVTMEAVFGSQRAWEVTPEAGARFETHIGIAPALSETVDSDGANFRALVVDGGATKVLAKGTATAKDGWKRLTGELGDYAGKTVGILLEVDFGAKAIGDYAYWGNPMLLPGDNGGSATPVILISNDTLRADHLGCYGYGRATSHNIDAFAKDGVLFENAYSLEMWTLTSHLNMLTGLHPVHHGVDAARNLPESIVTLPELLREHGYSSGGFTGYQVWLAPWRGLAHGFDVYSTPEKVRSLFETLPLVKEWMDTRANTPMFLFFHNYDAHSQFAENGCFGCDLPYYPPAPRKLRFARELSEPASLRRSGRPNASDLLWTVMNGTDSLTPEEHAYMIALYDDAILGVDAGLGELFAHLKSLDLYDRALIIVTADHGEPLGEHGQYLHQHVIESSAKIPLIVKFPGNAHAGKRVSEMVTLSDMMPTVVDVLGVGDAAPPMDGRSLRKVVEGGVAPAPYAHLQRISYRAVRTNEWKLTRDLRDGSEQLYRIADDPHEKTNLIGEAPPVLGELRAELDRFFLEDPRGWHIAYSSPDPAWKGTITLTTEDSFASVKPVFGSALAKEELMQSDARSARINVGVIPRDEVIVRTADPAATITFSMTSTTPAAVLVGNAAAMESSAFQALLDPATAPNEPVAPSEAGPVIRIWHIAPAGHGTEAVPLTEEELELLRSGGYLGER